MRYEQLSFIKTQIADHEINEFVKQINKQPQRDKKGRKFVKKTKENLNLKKQVKEVSDELKQAKIKKQQLAEEAINDYMQRNKIVSTFWKFKILGV